MKTIKKVFIFTLLLSAAIIFLNLSSNKTFAADGFARGTGTESDPYLIETSEQLALLKNYHDVRYFELIKDIDLTEYLSVGGGGYNGGEGWRPIGLNYDFLGKLDGKGFKIMGLWINNGSSLEYAGLFGTIGNGGLIKNLGVEIGVNKIKGVYSGGITGTNYGTIENCYVLGDIEGKHAGGLIGYNSGSIKNCYANGNINGTENAGGFAGASDNIIENCYSIGQTTGGGASVGGFAGAIYKGSIKNCYSVGYTAGEGKYTGGFIGMSNATSSIKNCYSIGDTNGSSNFTGGFIGNTYGSVESCYSNGNTTGSGDYTGGFAGYNKSIITNCYSLGKTTGANSILSCAGGFVGASDNLIENCYSSGTVTGRNIGGFAGYIYNVNVKGCYYDKTVSGQFNAYGTPLTTEQMMKKGSFTGWVFNNDIDNIQDGDTWVIFEESGHYPFILHAGAVIIMPDDGQYGEYGQTPNITSKVSGTVIGGSAVKPEDCFIKLGLEQYDIGERNIILNSFEIKGTGQVWFVNGIKYNVTKISQPIVMGVEVEDITTSSITLTRIEGVEYCLEVGGEWKDSSVFSGLNANTLYIFYIRYKETDYKAAGSITSFTAKTAKIPQDAVSGVSAIDITSSSITLTEIEDVEYRLGEEGKWQDSNIFLGLNANTEYTFYIRFKETEDMAAGAITSFTVTTARKSSQPGVTGVVAVITTPASITLTEIEGVEYRLGENGKWQNSNIFLRLIADTEYTFYFRYKETDDKFAGTITSYTAKTAKKISQPEVTGVAAVNTTHLSITLTKVEGAEYRLGENGEWQDSNIFTGLKADTEYTFYYRYKETEDKTAGVISSFTVRTAKSDDGGNENGNGLPDGVIKIIIISCSVAVGAAGIFCLYWFVFRKRKKKK